MAALRNNKLVFVALLCLAGWAIWNIREPSRRPAPHTVETPDYILYVPSRVDVHARYPLVIALSPAGDAQQMIDTWKGVAEQFQWLILSSKKFHNGIPGEVEWGIFKDIERSVREGALPVAVDQGKVLASGISGGAMGSHSFALFFPELISGVIANTGMMGAEGSYPPEDKYPHAKMVVFLASPTDFRYEEMKRDRTFLEGLDWKTEWIEFPGGHVLAPQEAYFQAARWVAGQWGHK